MSTEKKEPGAHTTVSDNTVSLEQYRSDTDKARVDARAEERQRIQRIEKLGTMSTKIIGAKATKALVDKMIESGTSIEEANDLFTDACARADAVKAPTEVTHEKAPSAELAGVKVPVLAEREDVLAKRFRGGKVAVRSQAFNAIATQAEKRGLLTDAGEGA